MNTKTGPSTAALICNAYVAGALAVACQAISALNDAGVSVIAAMANGRRPLLIVDRIPEGAASVIKRRNPNGMGGTTIVRAAEWHGCQLEAMQDEYPQEAKIKLCGRALETANE